MLCELRGLFGGVIEDSGLMRSEAASLREWFPAFGWNALYWLISQVKVD